MEKGHPVIVLSQGSKAHWYFSRFYSADAAKKNSGVWTYLWPSAAWRRFEKMAGPLKLPTKGREGGGYGTKKKV
jgi:hypothetical protein